jgi:hypothetical protein
MKIIPKQNDEKQNKPLNLNIFSPFIYHYQHDETASDVEVIPPLELPPILLMKMDKEVASTNRDALP